MTQGTAPDSRQNPHADFWEMHFKDADVAAFLSEVVSELVDDIGGPSHGISWAITLIRSGETTTLAAGSAPSRAADEAQRSFDYGPGREAVRSGEFVFVGDTSMERRWPGYASAAAAEGVRSLLSVPLLPAEVFGAAVNLYAAWPHVFNSADITAAVRLARQVSRALRLVQQLAHRYAGSADLSSAQLSRVLAGLALRTLVRDYGLSEAGALDYLRNVAAGPVPERAPAREPSLVREPAGGAVRVFVSDSGQVQKEPQPSPLPPAPHAGDSPPIRRRRRRVESPA